MNLYGNFARLCKAAAPRLIYYACLFFQVENDFCSYSINRMYVTTLAESIRKHVKNQALLYTADRPFSVQKGFLTNSSFAAIFFGPASTYYILPVLHLCLRALRYTLTTAQIINSTPHVFRFISCIIVGENNGRFSSLIWP